jgi:hypothetical protein
MSRRRRPSVRYGTPEIVLTRPHLVKMDGLPSVKAETTHVEFNYSWATFKGKFTSSTFAFQVVSNELYTQILGLIAEDMPFAVIREDTDKEDVRVEHLMPHGGQATRETTRALLEVTTCPAHQLCCTEFDFQTKMIKGLGALISFPDRALVYPHRLVKCLHDVFMVNAQTSLANMLINGEGGKKDLEKARCLFISSAELGLVDAQTGLARMLFDGVGGPQDSNKALQLLDRAMKQGSTEAQRLIDKYKADTDSANAAGEALLAEEEAEKAASLTVKAKKSKGRKAKARPSKLASIDEVAAAETRADTDADATMPTIPAVCTLADIGDRLFISSAEPGRDVEPPESTIGGQTTCIVCFTNPKTHLAAPCGHQCACGTCAAKMNQCPYCRELVAMWVIQRIV